MSAVGWLGTLLLVAGSPGLLYFLFLGGVVLMVRAREEDGPAGTAAVLIPAHNEETAIGFLLEDLRRQTRAPAAVVVVSHRSTDGTARTAAAGGAEVVTLDEGEGKGAALAAGLAFLRGRPIDGVLVIDADCRVDPEFLARTRVVPGEVVQTRVVLEATPGDRGLVYDFLSRLENRVFHAGRERLGLPAFLRGTGMILGREALARVPWRAEGLTEDREQGFRFLRAGVPVRHLEHLEVRTAPPGRAGEAWAQRRRWISSGLPAHVVAATATARRGSAALGGKAWELPLAVVADARSQWLLLLVAGTGCAAVGGGPWRWGGALLAAGALAAVAAGIAWYGFRFARVLVQIPVSVGVALASAACALLGKGPGRWRRGRTGVESGT